MSSQQQTFASKMQELIDEHRENLSTEFVRVSMEACQKEYNNPTNFVFVRCYLRILDTYSRGCTDCDCTCTQSDVQITVQETLRIARLDLTAFEKIKAHISKRGDVELTQGSFEGDDFIRWFTYQAVEDMGLARDARTIRIVKIEQV